MMNWFLDRGVSVRLENGANNLFVKVDIQAEEQTSLLHFAAQNGHVLLVRELLTRNVKTDAKNNHGQTAYDATRNKVIKKLLDPFEYNTRVQISRPELLDLWDASELNQVEPLKKLVHNKGLTSINRQGAWGRAALRKRKINKFFST
jgi:ankyrin repeat protein